jgi:RNA polymerase sigma-70 factor, ECF subfamily
MAREAPVHQRGSLDTDALYRAHVRAIYAFVYSKVGNREAAEDLTSDVFLRALAHIDLSRDEHSIVAWLYMVARNLVNDYWRASHTVRVIALDEVRNTRALIAPPDYARQNQTARRASELLNMLPTNYRAVLQYRVIEGLTVAETADRMTTSRSNVKVLQHRALKRAAELQESVKSDER